MPLDDDSATGRVPARGGAALAVGAADPGSAAWLDLRRGRNQAALERARRVMANDPDNTESPPNLAELAVVGRRIDAERLIEPLARQDPEAAGQMFPILRLSMP